LEKSFGDFISYSLEVLESKKAALTTLAKANKLKLEVCWAFQRVSVREFCLNISISEHFYAHTDDKTNELIFLSYDPIEIEEDYIKGIKNYEEKNYEKSAIIFELILKKIARNIKTLRNY
jgi:hypothetical protein